MEFKLASEGAGGEARPEAGSASHCVEERALWRWSSKPEPLMLRKNQCIYVIYIKQD